VTARGRARLLYFSLYLAEGAPIGFVWWALPTRLRGAGVDVADITALTSTLVLPWALKFLWAPAVDTLRARGLRLTTWIAVSQLCMGASLVPLLFLDLTDQLGVLYPLLLVHAFAAATQDVAVDALCMAEVAPEHRGDINGWMQAGMLLGRAGFGGVLLLVEARIGMRPMVIALVATIWAALLVLVWLRPVEPAPPPPGATGRALATALRSGRIWLGLLHAAVAGAAYEGTAAVAGPWLRDRGLSQDTVGVLFAVPVVAAMAAGALVGGRLADRRGLRGTLMAAQGAVVVVVLALAVVAAAGSDAAALGLVVLLYAAVGAMTAASYALFMELAGGAAAATTFSAFMGMTNLCELWAVRAVGALHDGVGYPLAFAALALVTAAAVALVPFLRPPPRISGPTA